MEGERRIVLKLSLHNTKSLPLMCVYKARRQRKLFYDSFYAPGASQQPNLSLSIALPHRKSFPAGV